MKRAKGSPFKSIIVRVDFKDEGIMYTVRHVTDNFTHDAHISDFVAMGDGSYPRMKQVAKADPLVTRSVYASWTSSRLLRALVIFCFHK